MNEPTPLVVVCEGSWCPTHRGRIVELLGRLSENTGMCSMCGQLVVCDDDGVAGPHDRPDILAMLDRGDYDDAR
jgi:hypothetical protein